MVEIQNGVLLHFFPTAESLMSHTELETNHGNMEAGKVTCHILTEDAENDIFTRVHFGNELSFHATY